MATPEVLGVAAHERGLVRRAIMTLAMFALLVAGLHAGADRFDDVAFGGIDLIDGVADRLIGAAIAAVAGWLGAGQPWIEAATYRAHELIDFDAKLALSRELALIWELVADLLVAVAILDLRSEPAGRTDIPASLRRAISDPSIAKILGPVALAAASIAGIAAVSREVHVAVDDLAARMMPLAAASWAARGVAVLATILMFALAGRAVLRSIERANALGTADRERGLGAARRRTRGLWTAVVLLPLALISASDDAILSVIHTLVGA